MWKIRDCLQFFPSLVLSNSKWSIFYHFSTGITESHLNKTHLKFFLTTWFMSILIFASITRASSSPHSLEPSLICKGQCLNCSNIQNNQVYENLSLNKMILYNIRYLHTCWANNTPMKLIRFKSKSLQFSCIWNDQIYEKRVIKYWYQKILLKSNLCAWFTLINFIGVLLAQQVCKFLILYKTISFNDFL